MILLLILVTSLIFVCIIYADFQILSKLLSVDLDTFFGPPPSTHLIKKHFCDLSSPKHFQIHEPLLPLSITSPTTNNNPLPFCSALFMVNNKFAAVK